MRSSVERFFSWGGTLFQKVLKLAQWRRKKNAREVRKENGRVASFASVQCFAEKFHNWGQCPKALEKVGTFEKKAGTL